MDSDKLRTGLADALEAAAEDGSLEHSLGQWAEATRLLLKGSPPEDEQAGRDDPSSSAPLPLDDPQKDLPSSSDEAGLPPSGASKRCIKQLTQRRPLKALMRCPSRCRCRSTPPSLLSGGLKRSCRHPPKAQPLRKLSSHAPKAGGRSLAVLAAVVPVRLAVSLLSLRPRAARRPALHTCLCVAVMYLLGVVKLALSTA